MLAEFDKILVKKSGLISVQYDSVLSPMFIYLYFIEEFMKNCESHVIMISMHTTSEFLKYGIFCFFKIKIFLKNTLKLDILE